MNQIIKNKNNLRKWAKEIRQNLNIENISLKLVELLQKTEEYKNAKNILIFYPLKYEINLLKLIDDKSKTFFLPKIDGDNMLCCQYKNNTEFCISCFGTKEPRGNSVDKSLIDLAIIPALCCDKNKHRLGYGKGYYDKFLKNCNIKKIICIPKELIVENVFPQEHDVPVDLIISY